LACEALEAGSAFTATAEAVGLATAQVHRGLLRTCGQVELEPEPLVESLLERLRWAVDAVPELAEHVAAARRLFETAGGQPLPAQRIHGDLHLGQVLDAGERGWVLLDFEGEPLRPLADRCRPDLVLRDIAGMLRSFDYAAGHAALGLSADDPARVEADRWATECREAFLTGYRAGRPAGGAFDADLLAALELDKALYEVVYEARNRPTWLEIPLRAVRRLVARA
jgi:predicted trehalose synthase